MEIYKVKKYIYIKRFYNDIDIINTCIKLLDNYSSDMDSIPNYEIFNKIASNLDQINFYKNKLMIDYPEFYESIKDKIPIEDWLVNNNYIQEDGELCETESACESEENYLSDISDDNLEEIYLSDITDDNLEEKVLKIIEKINEQNYRNKINRLIRNHKNYILCDELYFEDYVYSIYFEEYQNILFSPDIYSIEQLLKIATILNKTIPEDIITLSNWNNGCDYLYLKNGEICIDTKSLAGYYVTISKYEFYINMDLMYDKYQSLNNFFETNFGNIYINAKIQSRNININHPNANKYLVMLPNNTKEYDSGNYEQFLKKFIFVPDELYGYYADSLNQKINFRDYSKYLEMYPKYKKIIYNLSNYRHNIIFDDIVFCKEDLDILEKYDLENIFLNYK